jgi:hypothetical protein
MLSALAVFERNIDEARHLTSLYDYLSGQISLPYPFEDLLRAQLVYAVGAFDKLIHDVIRIGMLESFLGVRAPTPRYLAETISLEFHGTLLSASIPPREFLFEQEVVKKLGWQSFQRPDLVANGLSLIWDENRKWDKIAAAMGSDKQSVTTKLKLIVTRRNAIVHEADMDPLRSSKTPLSKIECADVTDVVQRCGRAIVGLVK